MIIDPCFQPLHVRHPAGYDSFVIFHTVITAIRCRLKFQFQDRIASCKS